MTRVLDGLVIFQEQFDRDGRYTDQLNMILESFDTCDDKAETASEQAMNALYHCVILASLLAQEHCTTQNMVNQVKKEDELKGVGISKWMIGVISFILGIIFTLCAIHLLKLIKNKKKSEQSNSPVIQAEEISEVDKNDEILRDFIIEK